MDPIEKLFKKIVKADRLLIQKAIEMILARDFTGLNRKRLKGYQHIYRIRTGNYRIIYYDNGKEIILKAILNRDESTYSDF